MMATNAQNVQLGEPSERCRGQVLDEVVKHSQLLELRELVERARLYCRDSVGRKVDLNKCCVAHKL
jgi:hypothetical protein